MSEKVNTRPFFLHGAGKTVFLILLMNTHDLLESVLFRLTPIVDA